MGSLLRSIRERRRTGEAFLELLDDLALELGDLALELGDLALERGNVAGTLLRAGLRLGGNLNKFLHVVANLPQSLGDLSLVTLIGSLGPGLRSTVLVIS